MVLLPIRVSIRWSPPLPAATPPCNTPCREVYCTEAAKGPRGEEMKSPGGTIREWTDPKSDSNPMSERTIKSGDGVVPGAPTPSVVGFVEAFLRSIVEWTADPLWAYLVAPSGGQRNRLRVSTGVAAPNHGLNGSEGSRSPSPAPRPPRKDTCAMMNQILSSLWPTNSRGFNLAVERHEKIQTEGPF